MSITAWNLDLEDMRIIEYQQMEVYLVRMPYLLLRSFYEENNTQL